MSTAGIEARIANTDVTFACDPSLSLLDNAIAAGIELPYSCRKGVCGSCAGAVQSGDVHPIGNGAVRNETCREDEVLYCLCAPSNNVVIAPRSWKKIDPSARKKVTAKVYTNTLVAPDVSLLKLRFPAGQRIKFTAGQYLQIQMEDGSSRCYSMANPSNESDGATLHIRHVTGGVFSTRVIGLVPGDLLNIEMPYGHVDLADSDTRPIVFVVGGTGFAPVKSILDDMMRKRIKRPVSLIWGARDVTGLYLMSATDRWRKQWPDFRFIPALSDVNTADIPDVYLGRVDEALQSHFRDLKDHVVYCCGSPPMVAAVRQAALLLGADSHDFHADAFVPGPSST